MEYSDKELQERIRGVIKPRTNDEKVLEEALMPPIDERLREFEDIYFRIRTLAEELPLIDNPPPESISEERKEIAESIIQYRKKYPDLEKERLKELQKRTEQTDFGDDRQLSNLLKYCDEVWRFVKKPTKTKNGH